ncbi:MAG: substrate-binding domain-containing protein [Devosia sp.]
MTIRKLLAVATVFATMGLVSTAVLAQEKIIFVGGPNSDTFFNSMKQGFDQAVKDLGVDAQWTAPADFIDIVPNYTKLVEAAIASNPSALVIGNFFPDATNDLIKQAAASGIPVMIYNSGRPTWRELGAIGFIGEDSFLMGHRGGEIAVKAGVKNAICLNQIAANPTLETRCNGYIAAITEAGGTAKQVTLTTEDAGNSQKIQAAVAALLMADQTIDGVFTLGWPAIDALAAIKPYREQGRKIDLGTTDLSQPILEALEAGEMSYALDQQPYLQGYLGLLLTLQYVRYGLVPATETNTGPLVVDQSNAKRVFDIGAKYPGLRGAN